MAEQFGDPLARYHDPDETAKIRGLAETGIKGKWDNILLDPDYESGRWGGGKHIKDEWLEHPKETDPEFQGQVDNFLLEKFGVGSLGELRKIAEADDKEFSSFETTCREILTRKREDGKSFLNVKEKGLLQSQLSNHNLLRKMNIHSDVELNLDSDYLFGLFLDWLSKESSPSAKLVERTHHKVRQYFGVEKVEPEKIKPESVVRQRPVHPVGIEEKQVERAKNEAMKALAKLAAIREEQKVKKAMKQKVWFTFSKEEQEDYEFEIAKQMVCIWDEKELESMDKRDRNAIINFTDVWKKMAEGVSGKETKKRLLRINSDEKSRIARIYLEIDYSDGTKDFAFVTQDLLSKASINKGVFLMRPEMEAERFKNLLEKNKGKIAFQTSTQEEPVFNPKIILEVAPLNNKKVESVPTPVSTSVGVAA